MNVWELVTGSSTLVIDPGNTLWDHLNNLGGGGVLSFITQEIDIEEPLPGNLAVDVETFELTLLEGSDIDIDIAEEDTISIDVTTDIVSIEVSEDLDIEIDLD
jgi:hypothetical protein